MKAVTGFEPAFELPYSHAHMPPPTPPPTHPHTQVAHVSLRLRWSAYPIDDVAHAVHAALHANGFERACFIGHSYGGFNICYLACNLMGAYCENGECLG